MALRVGKTRMIAHVPARGLIGYHGEFLTDTRGTGVLNRVFHKWALQGSIAGRRAGVLISMEDGVSVACPLNLRSWTDVYRISDASFQGMIVGEHSRDNDGVNP